MTEEEILWQMPKPDVGFPVKVFPNGVPTEKPHLAFVARVHDRSIDAQSPLGTARGGVRHINDPVMQHTSEVNRRDWGGWDFTDEAKMAMETRDVIATLHAKVAEQGEKLVELQGKLQGALMTLGRLTKKAADTE